MQRLHLAAIGQARIELDQVAQRDADAAEADRQAGRLVERQLRRDADLAEARREPGRTDGVEQAHGRHVER